MQNLFSIKSVEPKPAPTLEHLIVLWNRLEETFKNRLDTASIARGTQFFWSAAINEGIITGEDVALLTELRKIRNKQVHSSTIDRKQVEYAIKLAEKLLKNIENKD